MFVNIDIKRGTLEDSRALLLPHNTILKFLIEIGKISINFGLTSLCAYYILFFSVFPFVE
ncbi:hypothetical protein A2732_02290 [Candidatus Nomurabacteria bacterium RIFCSPHIGHO2_01_FULL_40_10]|nr:MAG: hypothetical protein A2732_02290 [Candidatus Nomurabacteria bacterium RIFCSPHIGHO2_01_FULL_40_10]